MIKKLLQTILLIPIYIYRGIISPIKPPSCRYTPTCSEYAIQAIKTWTLKGMHLAIRRLLVCPVGGSGYDPVP